MKGVVGAGPFPIGAGSFQVRGIPGTAKGITGLRLANESPVTLAIEWSGVVQFLYPAMVDIFPTPDNPTSDLTVTPVNVFPAGFLASGFLLVEAAQAPDKWEGQYPITLPPGTASVGAISGIVPSSGQLSTYQFAQTLAAQYAIAPSTSITKRVTLLPGMQVLTIPIWGPASGNVNINVVGVASGFNYFSAVRTFSGGQNILTHVLVEPAFETVIDITIDATSAPVPPVTVNAKIIGGPNPVNQIDANIKDSFGKSLSADNFGNLEVTQQFATPAAWQDTAANYDVLFDGVPAANQHISLVNTLAGTTVRVYDFVIAFTASITSKFSIRDSLGRMIWVTQGGGQYFNFSRYGQKLQIGTGIELWNESAASVGVTVSGGWTRI